MAVTPRTALREATPEAPVVVVGGGLAGLSAALDLAEAGVPTTLVERRPFVGGKAYSFHDPVNGVELDNGQHIYLRCCTAYIALIDRLGLRGSMRLQEQLRVPVVDPRTQQMSAIEASAGVPAPLHLLMSILRYRHLSWRDKAMLGRAMWPMLRMGDRGRRRLDDVSFGDWLRARGQSDAVIDRFWDLIVLPTCNDRSDAVSAQQAILVFQLGLLRDPHGADIGVAKQGLSVVAEAALGAFQAAGGETLLGSAARALDHDGERVTGVVLGNGERRAAAGVVAALPPHRIAELLPEEWRGRFSALDQFELAPIVNVHVEWDRAVLREPFVAVLDPSVQYVFNRSLITEQDGPTQWVTCSLSGAHAEASMAQGAVAEAAIAGVRRAFPAAAEAEVLRWRVVKEMEATFRPTPGLGRFRLGTTTSVQNLLLAGAWTNTEWPATMESAVRSGQAAARDWLERT